MKKVILSFLIAILLVGSSFGQDDVPKHNINLNLGSSLIPVTLKLVASVDNTIISHSSPSFAITYDYSFTNRISAGVAVSQERAGLEYSNHVFIQDVDNVPYSFRVNMIRTNGSIRGLFHYKNTEKIDLFSGLRLGLTNYRVDLQANTEIKWFVIDKDFAYKQGYLVSYQLVVFGIRGYFTRNIGANVELSVGAPYFISGGLSFRI
jgi:hypothetical protein